MQESHLARTLLKELAKLSNGVAPVVDEGEMHLWHETHWRRLSDVELKQRIQHSQTKSNSVGRHKMNGTLEVMKVLAASPGFFSSAPGAVAFSNGVVVPQGGKSLCCKPDPNLRCRFYLPFDYPSKLRAPKVFNAYVESLFADDSDKREKAQLLNEFIGAALFGIATTFEQALLYWGGTGRNGKSVLLKIIEGLFPPTALVAVPPQRWGSEYYIAELIGARINIVGEIEKNTRIDGAAFKSVVSGDMVTGRPIRKEPVSFRPIAGHVFASNPLPPVSEPGSPFWRRWQVLKFNRIFSGTSSKSRESLIALVQPERAAVTVQALDHAAAALHRGALTAPASSREALSQWQVQSDQVFTFVAERCSKLESSALGEIYAAYRRWAYVTGHCKCSLTTFRERLTALGYEPIDGRVGLKVKHDNNDTTQEHQKYVQDFQTPPEIKRS